MNIRCCFLIIFCFLFYCIVKAACQQNHNRNNNHQTNRIASNKNIITHRKRSLQQTSTLTFTTKITASDGESSNYFGDFNGVAISNNRIVVGAYGYNIGTGAAYLFMDPIDPESGRSYSQMAILLASDGQEYSQFGISVDIDGDIIVVGASQDASVGPGAVYIFRVGDNNNISQIAKITAQNGVAGDYFGWSVAIHGNFILVGAYGVAVNGSLSVGSAYLFVNVNPSSNDNDWTQIMQFQPNDLTEWDWFGNSVAMDDQMAVIGTWDYVNLDANAAYVFVPVDNIDSLSMWTQMAKLTGPSGSYFGSSVAAAGNSIVVGAPDYIKNNGNTAGAVFVFTKMDGSSSTSSSSSTWTQTNILLAADGAGGDQFGISVSISKDASTIVVGANLDDYNSTITDSGAAYLFRNSTATTTTVGWTQVGKYVAADRDSGDYLGNSIAIENSIVVVGAPYDDTATGSVYILDTENSPPPPPTTAPIQTTTEPTAEPVVPTFQPTLHPTTKPTDPPSTYSPTTMAPDTGDDNSNNLSSPPATSTPMTNVPTASKPMSPSISTTSAPTESPTTTTSDNNNNVIISVTVVVLGVVVVALGFFNYRLKRDRLLLVEQQQQQQQIMPTPLPPPSSWNNGTTAVNTDETPAMAEVIFPVQSAEDRTIPAEVLEDPPQTHAPPPAAAAANGNTDIIDAEKGPPEFKDQTRSATPPAGPSAIPPAGPMRNSQRNRDDPQHQDREEELPGTQEVQQQQQQLRDPPAAINL